MKKSMLLTAALLGAVSFTMLTGFDSAETAESVLGKYAEVSKETKSAAADTTIDIDANLNIAGMADLALAIDGTMPLQFSLEPLKLGVNGQFTIGMKSDGMGMDEQMGMGIEMYMTGAEDGTYGMYSLVTNTEDEEPATWDVTTLTAEETAEMNEAIAKALSEVNIDYASMPVSYTLAPSAVDVNGKECYELTSQLKWEDIKNVMQWAVDQAGSVAGEETADLSEMMAQLDQIDILATGLVMNLALDIDCNTYQAMKVHVDMDGSDWSIVQTLIASAMELTNEDGTLMDVTLTVENGNIDIVYDYDTPISIEVPAEALAAAN